MHGSAGVNILLLDVKFVKRLAWGGCVIPQGAIYLPSLVFRSKLQSQRL